MNAYSFLGLSLGAVFLSHTAIAQLPPTKQICTTDITGRYVVDRYKLLHWAISTSGVNSACLFDTNSNIPPSNDLLIEKLNAGTKYIPPLCSDADSRKEFYRQTGKAKLAIASLGQNTVEALSKKTPYKLHGKVVGSRDFSGFGLFSEAQTGMYIDCYSSNETTASSTDPGKSNQKDTVNREILFRESVNEFSKEKLGDAAGGKLSYESEDAVDEKDSNISKFALGYRFSLNKVEGRILRAFNSITPYIYFDSKKVATRNQGEPKETERVERRGVGISFQNKLAAGSHWNHFIDTSFSYGDERYKNTRLGDVSILYTPTGPGKLNAWHNVGTINIYPQFTPKLVYAKIFEEGDLNDEELAVLNDNERYLAYGGVLGFRIRSDSKAFDKTEFSASVTYFGLDDHQHSDTDLIKLDLTYYFDEEQRFGIEFGYTKGEDGVLLDEVDKWAVSLTVRN